MKNLKFKTLTFLVAMVMGGSAFAGLVNINEANSDALAMHLKGVGAKKAEAIVAHRKENGLFAEVGELVKVKGIGKGLLEKNLENISLSEGAVVVVGNDEPTKKPTKKPVVITKTKKADMPDKLVDKKSEVELAEVVSNDLPSKKLVTEKAVDASETGGK